MAKEVGPWRVPRAGVGLTFIRDTTPDESDSAAEEGVGQAESRGWWPGASVQKRGRETHPGTWWQEWQVGSSWASNWSARRSRAEPGRRDLPEAARWACGGSGLGRVVAGRCPGGGWRCGRRQACSSLPSDSLLPRFTVQARCVCIRDDSPAWPFVCHCSFQSSEDLALNSASRCLKI